MNKNEFLRAIADKTEATIKDANAFYEAFVETVQEVMKANDKKATCFYTWVYCIFLWFTYIEICICS